MTTLHAPAGTLAAARRGVTARVLLALLVPAATALALMAAVLALLLTQPFVHAALDAAGSARMLGVSAAEAHALSDRTVAELLAGPGTFVFAGPDGRPFYDAAEAAHMRDVRFVLYSFVALAALGATGVAATLLRLGRDGAALLAVARGGAALAVGLAVVGALALVAFNVAFELFHRLLFPGGNWSFDPTRQRLVQLYPVAFWQISAAAFGGLGIVAGATVWFVARRLARARKADR